MSRESEADSYEHLGFLILLGLLTVGLTLIVWPFATSLLWAALPEDRLGPKPMEKAIKAMQVRTCTCVCLSPRACMQQEASRRQ